MPHCGIGYFFKINADKINFFLFETMKALFAQKVTMMIKNNANNGLSTKKVYRFKESKLGK